MILLYYLHVRVGDFPKYPGLIKINKVSYIYSYASGNSVSGTNNDSNK